MDSAPEIDPQHQDPKNIRTLLTVMARLRGPGGCPWDVEQTFDTIAPFTIEEAYEVADAIARNDLADLKEELGDLLFQTVFHAQMASEADAFTFDDVVEAVTTKMIRRHPHVFGDDKTWTQEEQGRAWEEMKAAERAAKGKTSLLDDVPFGLPALTRAVKLQKRAARIGFDWPSAREVLHKINEETKELADAVDQDDPDAIEDEFGDLLFVLANLSRHLKIDPEHALRRANEKFSRRFRAVETRHNGAEEKPDLETMEAWWVDAKATEKNR
ncbi:MAG: nucleoside triphosphate pyrophosphohydrolase [Pseudomonadota bacterium]